MWRGSCFAKFVTIITFVLLIVSRIANTSHPLILGQIVADISCDPENPLFKETGCPDSQQIYTWIAIYACMKFFAEFLNYMREIPFAYVSANAELHIATMVYRHI